MNADRLEKLMTREQLMIDIDCIVESKFDELYILSYEMERMRDELIQELCDRVCHYLPAS